MTNINLNNPMSTRFCPICDDVIHEIDNGEDWVDSYYYCCSMEPFYHMYKLSNDEELFLCNEGKIVIDTGDIFHKQNIITITYKSNDKEDSIVLTSLPYWDPKELPAFIKAAVNNIAFL